MLYRSAMLRTSSALSICLLLAACGDGANAPASASATSPASAKPSAKPATSAAAPQSATAAVSATPTDAPQSASGSAPPATSGSTAAGGASADPGKKCKERGLVTAKELTEGFKANKDEWVGCTIKMKGELNSVSLNKWILTPKGLTGPDDKGTWFAVDFRDIGADRAAPLASCNIEAGKTYDELLAAVGKGTVIEVSGPVEGTFGNIAPCTVGRVEPMPKTR